MLTSCHKQFTVNDACTCYIPRAPTQLVLNVSLVVSNLIANHTPTWSGYFAPGLLEVNPHDPQWVVYGVDLRGDELFTLVLCHVSTNEMYVLPTANAYYSGRWHHHGWFYYNAVDMHTGVPQLVYRVCFALDATCAQSANPLVPELVYTEPDARLTTELVSAADTALLFIKWWVMLCCVSR
jgi:protease II